MNESGVTAKNEGRACMRIAVDAYGGDRSPAEPVRGACDAARRYPDAHILLVGRPDGVEQELENLGGERPSNLEIVEAAEVVGMHESPVSALRGKKDSSILVGVRMVKDGRADAFLSAGNTGAMVAASTLHVGLIPGVMRPGIAVPVMAVDHPALIIDVGANVNCKPAHLLQYAVMATVFAREVMALKEPRVGLLNVGEEARKGAELQKKAYDLLETAPIHFVGNVEARDLFFGGCDIVLCEGFTGNVLLKTCESILQKLLEFLERESRRNLRRRLGFMLSRDVFRATRKATDYAEYGGAILLGVDGVIIISHGRSDARAIASAIREARRALMSDINRDIAEVLARMEPG